MKNQRTVLTVIGLLVTLGFATIPISKFFDEFASVRNMIGYELIWWTLVTLVLLFVRYLERRPLTSIGFRKPGIWNILIGIASGLVILAGLVFIYYVVFPALHVSEDQQMSQLVATPYWWRFITVVRAAVAEEIFFRGYAIERLQELTGSVKFAGAFSCIVFAVEHVGFWNWSHILIAGFAGIILTVLYIWRRNLWVNMIAHFVVDGAAFLLG